MKIAKLGILFRILAILLVIFTSIMTFFLVTDLRRWASHGQNIVQIDVSTSANRTINVTENGWKIKIGSFKVSNPGKRLSVHRAYISIDVVNKSTTPPKTLVELTTMENIKVSPGESKNITLPVLILDDTLEKSTSFLFKALRKEFYTQINESFPELNLDEAGVNTTFNNGTVFNRVVFNNMVLNGTILNETAMEGIKKDDLVNMEAFNDSLVRNTELKPANLSQIDINDDELWNSLGRGFERFIDYLVTHSSISGEATFYLGYRGISIIGITIKPKIPMENMRSSQNAVCYESKREKGRRSEQ